MTMIFGTHDANTLQQLADVASRAKRVALMADGHVGYIMPIGGVAGFVGSCSVSSVGYDIACGNAAIRTSLTLEDITAGRITRAEAQANPERLRTDGWLVDLARYIADTLSFGIGRKNTADDAPTDHPLFTSGAWDHLPAANRYRDDLRDKARRQLGTIGSGNHYVDVFYDEAGTIWVGVHFGSRGLGHTIASDFMALSQGRTWGERVKEAEALLDLATPLGAAYWDLMHLCGEYAYAGREWVARKVVSLMNGGEVDLVHNHHNFAWKEMHDGEELVVVRKGATPAFPGQRGFVGGSMGDDAVILEGTRAEPGSPIAQLQEAALFSTVHGAGRVMSRTEAAGKRDRKTGALKLDATTGLPVKPPKVSPEMMHDWVRARGTVLRGGGVDEAPVVYRRLPDVLAAQQQTVTVLHTLSPIIVVMAGADEIDPYKD